ncbi:MAG: N-6 DNA methylase [Spirochaetota bacterium]|jgi:hypothetical protein|nr:N-6 DNA methylase [Spirochaetota bacterium]
MPISRDEIKARAARFAASDWKDKQSEKSSANGFVREFLKVFGIDQADDIGCFENPALRESGQPREIPCPYPRAPTGRKGTTPGTSRLRVGWMDYFAPKMIVIEMKSRGANLDEALKQLQDYVLHLPADQITDHLMVSDFENILYFHRTTGIRKDFLTRDLLKHIHLFSHLADLGENTLREDTIAVNVKAAEKMAKLHDALYKIGYTGHALEVYLVRLLFCMFANDTLIFPKDAFLRYVQNSAVSGSDLCSRLYRLFKVLNTPNDKRADTVGELAEFLYINGGLFEEDLPLAEFDKNMRSALLECMANFDWSEVSPAVFGSMFQGVMDASMRRELGAHYTSEENILKLINPLFMDTLRAEFAKAKNSPAKLDALHDTISRLKFLDPACGCGNFLIIAYRELRLLEMEIIKKKIPKAHTGQLHLDIAPLRKVRIEQFFGIELEDFPCQIARAGLWLTEHQMNQRLSAEYGVNFAQFPLGKGARIEHGNALRMDWASVVPREELSYIMGNPPFNGARIMNESQKDDLRQVFGNYKGAGNLDYVTAWYYKAAQFMHTHTHRSLFLQPLYLQIPLRKANKFLFYGSRSWSRGCASILVSRLSSGATKLKGKRRCIALSWDSVFSKQNRISIHIYWKRPRFLLRAGQSPCVLCRIWFSEICPTMVGILLSKRTSTMILSKKNPMPPILSESLSVRMNLSIISRDIVFGWKIYRQKN